jgi:hypothetical protein
MLTVVDGSKKSRRASFRGGPVLYPADRWICRSPRRTLTSSPPALGMPPVSCCDQSLDAKRAPLFPYLSSLYEAFGPAEARGLAARLEIHYTPEHGSWLNVAEIEQGVLARQALGRRIPTLEAVQKAATARADRRNRVLRSFLRPPF